MGARLMACSYTGKKVFFTEDAAIVAAAKLQKHHLNMRVYRCGMCKMFHHTTIKKKKKREKPDESIPD